MPGVRAGEKGRWCEDGVVVLQQWADLGVVWRLCEELMALHLGAYARRYRRSVSCDRR